MKDVTLMLQAIGCDDPPAAETLPPMVYQQLRQLAAVHMARETPGQTLQATALAHEAWLRLMGKGGHVWQNRGHFFGAASEAMRRILIENARRKARLKRGGDCQRVDIEEMKLTLAEATPDEKLVLLNEALAALEAENPERARVVVMKFFGGLTNKEIAGLLGIGERTVNRHWLCARSWLFLQLQSEP